MLVSHDPVEVVSVEQALSAAGFEGREESEGASGHVRCTGEGNACPEAEPGDKQTEERGAGETQEALAQQSPPSSRQQQDPSGGSLPGVGAGHLNGTSEIEEAAEEAGARGGEVPPGGERLPESNDSPVVGEVVLRFEPFILAVDCRTADAASWLVSTAIQAGFRESGDAGGGPSCMRWHFKET